MISIRKFWWAALVATAVAGCSSEEANPGGGTNAPPVTPGPAPTGGAMSGEMKPAEPAKTEAPAAPAEAPKVEPPAVTPAAPAEAAPEKKADATTLSAEEVAEIKKLPPADAALALKQMVCPVSGEHLGGDMGAPVKVSAEGKTFFLCCKSCNKDVLADPKAVVAKLKP
jgi:YHS domain-containing protein